MKIALVILHADPARGGAERYTVDLAAALGRRGQEVSLISSESLGVSGLTRAGRYRAFLNALGKHLPRNRYDIVHAMLPVRHCDVYHPHAGMAVEQTDKLNAVFNPRRRAMARVERELLTGPKPPIVIALSEYVKRSIRRHYDIPDECLATLFNAVRTDWFVPGERETGDKACALIVANDFRRKGLTQAIEAVARIHKPAMYLQVIGKETSEPWRRLASRLGMEKRFCFSGETHNVLPYYQKADFFVLPTKHDPCSLVVLEALATGLPVISTRFNGACEIMTDGVHGYVLDDPADVNALAEAMRKMLDPVRRAEMSRACLELRPKLSYEHHLDELEAIYRSARR